MKILDKIFTKEKKLKLQVLRIIKMCPLKKHAWVETDKGIFRKEIKNLPREILKGFY